MRVAGALPRSRTEICVQFGLALLCNAMQILRAHCRLCGGVWYFESFFCVFGTGCSLLECWRFPTGGESPRLLRRRD
jgi:hypothetical protein